MATNPGTDPRPAPQHKPTDAHAGKLAAVAVALAGLLAAAVLAAYGMMRMYGAPSYPRTAIEAPPIKITSAPQARLQEYLKRQRETLSSLGWTDRQAGIAHIPIDRAIEILAARSGSSRGQRDEDGSGEQ
jgi:hypothetical protein